MTYLVTSPDESTSSIHYTQERAFKEAYKLMQAGYTETQVYRLDQTLVGDYYNLMMPYTKEWLNRNQQSATLPIHKGTIKQVPIYETNYKNLTRGRMPSTLHPFACLNR